MDTRSAKALAAAALGRCLLQCTPPADGPREPSVDALVVSFHQISRVYLSDGSGVFIGSDLTADTHSSLDVALGDLDGDGDLDAIVVNYHGQTNRRYLNDGSGSFTGSDATADAHDSLAVALGNLDGK